VSPPRRRRDPLPMTAASIGPQSTVLRSAEPHDVPAIVGLIRELADFEKLSHLVQVTPQSLHPHLFGERPVAESVVAERGGRVVGFALFFTNFSTFLGKPGLYLEDLYVQPAHRGAGVGRALLVHLAGVANQRGYGRFEWSVLDWNADAIRFYERMGATLLPEWRICRVSGAALRDFAR
jgi:GNAT superfamily N-acetyltransferase